jgi:hypothetical protein|tara:strand:+ start:4817 stop:6013 length:1197 start_codon:yes stop_codon:yes gene_type:complete
MPAGWAAASVGLNVLGIGMGVLGANDANNKAEKAAKAQYEQAKKLYEFDWESSLRKYEYSKTAVDVQRRQAENVRQYKTELAEQSWQHQNHLREYEYKNAVAAFNRSEEQFEEQIALNTLSSVIAQEEATRSFNEAQISMNFQKEGMTRDLYQALDTSAFQKADLNRERNYAIGNAANQRRRNELEYQVKSIDSAFAAQENAVKALLGEGQARARGTGRSAGKAIQSVLAAAGRSQAQIVQNMATAENQFRIQARSIDHTMINAINVSDLQSAKIDNDIDYKRQEYNQGLRELQASMDSAKSAFKSNMMKINRDQQAADMQAHYNRLSEPSMGPEIPRPIELPESVFLDPLKPIKPPKPVKNAPMTQSAWTTAANAMTGLAGIANQVSGYKSTSGVWE